MEYKKTLEIEHKVFNIINNRVKELKTEEGIYEYLDLKAKEKIAEEVLKLVNTVIYHNLQEVELENKIVMKQTLIKLNSNLEKLYGFIKPAFISFILNNETLTFRYSSKISLKR